MEGKLGSWLLFKEMRMDFKEITNNNFKYILGEALCDKDGGMSEMITYKAQYSIGNQRETTATFLHDNNTGIK